MKQETKIVRLTLCAPSDVKKEMAIVASQVEQWNLHHWDVRNCGIKLRHWLTDASPDLSDRPQGVINRQIIDDSDAIVALFWSRFGTPTSVAKSGTEEEIRRAIAAGKRVFLYFSRLEPIPADADETQLANLESFREEMREKGLTWSFASRSEFKEQFARHLDAYMDEIIFAQSPPKKSKKRGSIQQSGRFNTAIYGDGNVTTINNRPAIVRQVVPPPPGSITSEQQQQIAEWIERLAETTMGKTRGEAFAMWWSRVKKKFKVEKYEHIKASEFGLVESWAREQLAITKHARRAKAPERWRTDLITAIKAAMRSMGRTNEDYYPELSSRLKMKSTFVSLTKLTKTDLERVYRMVLADARNR